MSTCTAPSPRSGRVSRLGIAWALLLGVALTALSACSPAQTSTVASPTATKPPAGVVLFQADWSRGLADWKPSSGWNVVGDYVETDGSDGLTLTIPYQPTVDDYAVEYDVQVVSVVETGGYFSLAADEQTGRDGYHADINHLLKGGIGSAGLHPSAQIYISPMDAQDPHTLHVIDYEPGYHWRTYRVEVHDNFARFLRPGSAALSSATSVKSKHLSNGPLRFHFGLAILRLGAVRVLTA